MDQYLTLAAEIHALLDQSDDAPPELGIHLARIQAEFREALEGKAAELASFLGDPDPREGPANTEVLAN